MSILLNYGLRSLWIRRRVSAATAAGVALTVFVLAASQMLAEGLKSTLVGTSSQERAIVMQQNAAAESESRVRQAVLTLVAAAPGVSRGANGEALVSGETINVLALRDLNHATRLASVQVRGVTPTAFAIRPNVRIISGRQLVPGTNEAIVGVALAGRYEGLALNDELELKRGRKFKVVGVFEAPSTAHESEVWADLESVRAALRWEGFLSSVTAQLSSPAEFEAFANPLKGYRVEGLLVEPERAYYSRVSSNLFAVIVGLGGIVTVIFSLGAILGAMITMHSAVGQRRREIGVLRALGFSAPRVLLAFLAESILLALAGAVIGLAVALSTTFFRFSTTNIATGQELAFGFVPDVAILAGSLLAGVTLGVGGGFWPAVRAARISPITAMRA